MAQLIPRINVPTVVCCRSQAYALCRKSASWIFLPPQAFCFISQKSYDFFCCLVFASSRTSVCFAIAAANFCPLIFGLGHFVPRRPTQKRSACLSPLRARTLPRDSALRKIRYHNFLLGHYSIL